MGGPVPAEASPREGLAQHPRKCGSHAGPGFRLRRRTEVSHCVRGAAGDLFTFRLAMRHVARSLVTFAIVASSAGCILTKDLPDPALDIPDGYKAARLTNPTDAPPTLDWWRGFRSSGLNGLMEEAQRVNLDIAAAVARVTHAD